MYLFVNGRVDRHTFILMDIKSVNEWIKSSLDSIKHMDTHTWKDKNSILHKTKYELSIL